MRVAPEGMKIMLASTAVLGLAAVAAVLWFWPAAIPLAAVWAWSILFFRDPSRNARLPSDEMCAPADGTVADITTLDHYDPIDGPAIRVGIFLSLFNVHVNRAPCDGMVRSVNYRPGVFLAAMNPKAGEFNESNTIVIDRPTTGPGPVVVRQIVGIAARRIVCHLQPGDRISRGARFGLIRFGSRTELIIGKTPDTTVLVRVGDKVRAGITGVIRQPDHKTENPTDARAHEQRERIAPQTSAATA